MGYAKENRKITKKLKIIKTVVLVVAVLLLVAFCVFSYFVPMETWQYYVKKPKTGKRATGELRVHFLDVGQGDCTLIELPDGKIMMIDGGNGEKSTQKTVLRYLNALDVDTIDYLVVTHADSDHCGSLDAVLKYKQVKRAFLPIASETENGDYASFYAALVKEGCPFALACPPDGENLETQIQSGDTAYKYTFAFLYPHRSMLDGATETPKESNARSVVSWLDYQGASILFTGDAPVQTEQTLLRDDTAGLLSRYGVELSSTEILKVAHHGGNGSTALEFLKRLGVKTAVISCGENNAYGHPSDEVTTALTSAGAEIMRTDKRGHILLTVKKDGSYAFRALGK